MPTADDYDQGAARLESIADDVERAPRPVRAQFDQGVLVGGEFTAAIGALIETDEATCKLCAAEVRDPAQECRRRAEICRQYEADLAAYRDATRRHQSDLRRWQVAQDRFRRTRAASSHPAPYPARPDPTASSRAVGRGVTPAAAPA